MQLAEARAHLRKHGGDVIHAAFWQERSRHAVCMAASRMFGCSPDKIEAMIVGDTANPDAMLLGYCAKMVRDRTGKPTPICHVLAHVIAVGEWA